MRTLAVQRGKWAPPNELSFGMVMATGKTRAGFIHNLSRDRQCKHSAVKRPEYDLRRRDLDSCALQGTDIGSNIEAKESFMKNTFRVGLVLCMILIFGAGSVLAADQKRDRKRDRSCRTYTTTDSCVLTLAAGKQRDRKRDRSCQSLNPATDESLTLAADRKRDRKRDGSCRS